MGARLQEEQAAFSPAKLRRRSRYFPQNWQWLQAEKKKTAKKKDPAGQKKTRGAGVRDFKGKNKQRHERELAAPHGPKGEGEGRPELTKW